MGRNFIVGLVLSVAAVACAAVLLAQREPATPTLQVFSGAGLMRPMDELVGAYREETDAQAQVAYGGSGILMAKLAAGQPCDVFIPGAAKNVEDASRGGWVVAESRADLVRHVPALAVSMQAERQVTRLEDLARPGVRVGLGDPDGCAIGRTADLILERNGLAEAVAGNVKVRTPTVNQLILYLTMGQIDAAIVWEDLIALPEAAGKVRAVPIPAEQNVVSAIAAARGAASAHPEEAENFMRFLISPPAQEIWLKHGFTPCDE